MPDPDTDALFNDDYLYFYAAQLTDQRSDAETDLLCTLLTPADGTEVLDLACGHGRLANRLAERGCQVTALDASPVFLDHARRDAHARGVTVDYVHGDMRDLPWTEQFDVVLNWFTSFGYFDDQDNRHVLHQAFRALRPDGRLLLEMNNYTGILRRYQPSLVVERDGDMLIDQHQLDPLTGCNHVTRTTLRDNQIRRTHYSVRMFAYPEIRDWLLDTGFTAVRGYNEHGTALTADDRRMVVSAQR